MPRTPLLLGLAVLALHASEFPTPYNSEPGGVHPIPAAEAVAQMQLPPGFKASVFAAEPDVQNPIAMAWDARGRLWVAENYTYAEASRKFDLSLRDRILIFEDKDGDAHFDSRTVFTDELQMLTSIEVGGGGVWVMCPPQLLFYPDRNHDGKPDGPPEVALDGFTVAMESHHTFANGLRFGPDGWLYGRCGASTPGQLGRPGTPAAQRFPLSGTIWRYHPQRKVVEAISSGTTNPWGHDWNEHGELFFINTVNGHLWHDFAGAHFLRPHTFDPNPHVYNLLDQHADHWHFDTAAGWQKSRDGAANNLGGGHAHVGLMIYQGDDWPPEYRGHLFTLNLHGRRANQEILERSGSGYVGRHGSDFFVAGDPWFRGMDLSSGPDGGVYVLDWSDTGECHESSGVHRTSGRIYKITYGEPKRPDIGDVSQLTPAALAQLHKHPNEWFSRQARLELAWRAAQKSDIRPAVEGLREIYGQTEDVVLKLRALWTLQAMGALTGDFLRAQLGDPNEHIRAWALRLLTDDWPLDTTLSQRPVDAETDRRASSQLAESSSLLPILERLAETDSSGLIRLVLASTLQRLPVSDRPRLARPLLAHAEDAGDHNLPLLIWYGLIPLGETDPKALAGLAENCALPLTLKLMARRISEEVDQKPEAIDRLLNMALSHRADFQKALLAGMTEALTGWRKARRPAHWDAFAALVSKSADAAMRDQARDLAVVFGDGRALAEVKRVALDKTAPLNSRKVALQTLVDNGTPDLRAVCEQLLAEQFINATAARGLAQMNDPVVGIKLASAYRQFHGSERPQLLSVLVSRPSFASALLDAVAEKRIPREDLTVFHARQIRSLGNAELNAQLARVWGELRETSQDKQAAIAAWKAKLANQSKADLGQGRLVFNTACAACHTLYGEGGKVGPDLTGSGRENLDYLLENIIDPSAIVPAEFRMSIVDLKDGRSLNAIVVAKSERTLTVKTMTETLVLERGLIESIRESALSLMPEGLIDSLKPEQTRDLIAYLRHSTQVPLPAQP